ncbi:hypothetical protein J6590_001675 [Homalodisca vitripennis]|nr:hypothetical protein J6590_001675 [Homalodisca vitripennis]
MTGGMRVRSGGVERVGAQSKLRRRTFMMGNSIQEMLEILGPDVRDLNNDYVLPKFTLLLGGTYRRLETEVHKAEYGNRLSSSTPHHFSSVFAYGASRSHRPVSVITANGDVDTPVVSHTPVLITTLLTVYPEVRLMETDTLHNVYRFNHNY